MYRWAQNDTFVIEPVDPIASVGKCGRLFCLSTRPLVLDELSAFVEPVDSLGHGISHSCHQCCRRMDSIWAYLKDVGHLSDKY